MHAFCAGIECMYFKEYNRADRTGKADLWCSTDTEVRRTEAVMESQSEESQKKPVCGQWILAGYEYGERENAGDTPIRTPYYLAGDEGEESKIHIYSEGDQLYADYYHCQMKEQQRSMVWHLRKKQRPQRISRLPA